MDQWEFNLPEPKKKKVMKKGIFGLMDIIKGPILHKEFHLYDGNDIVLLLYM